MLRFNKKKHFIGILSHFKYVFALKDKTAREVLITVSMNLNTVKGLVSRAGSKSLDVQKYIFALKHKTVSEVLIADRYIPLSQ